MNVVEQVGSPLGAGRRGSGWGAAALLRDGPRGTARGRRERSHGVSYADAARWQEPTWNVGDGARRERPSAHHVNAHDVNAHDVNAHDVTTRIRARACAACT
jgi:hypothetical protein